MRRCGLLLTVDELIYHTDALILACHILAQCLLVRVKRGKFLNCFWCESTVRIHVCQHNTSPFSSLPLRSLEEQGPLGLVGQRGGEMLEANSEEGSAVTQMSLWQ